MPRHAPSAARDPSAATHELPRGVNHVTTSLTNAGWIAAFLALTTADCMRDPVYWLRIKDGVVETDDLGSIGSIALFDDYALVAGHEGVRWKKFREASWRPVNAPDGVDDAWAELLAGPLPRVLIHDAVYTFKAGRLSPLRPWTLDETSGAVDRAGRLLGIDETKDGEDAWVVAISGTRAKISQPESSD